MVALLLLACQGDPSAAEVPITDPRPYVDPRIATGGPGFRVGSATPAATVPFGMVKLGPDTTSENGALPAYHCSGYYYDDDWIEGFSHLHMHGVGVPDLGTVLVMPTDGWTDDKREETGYRQPFDHADEAAEPGLYTVTLADGIRAELSATMHVGHHRYTFPADMAPTLVFDLEHNLDVRNSGGEIHVDADAGVVEGWTLNTGAFSGGSSAFPVYFHAVVDGGFTTFGTWADDEAHEGRTEAAGVDLGAWVRPGANPVSVRVGVSVVSLDNARANLAAELPEQDLAVTAAAASDAWLRQLRRIRIAGGTERERRIFYTSLYHLLQMPTTYSDANGEFRGFDGQTRSAFPWVFHSDLSLWDTYRTAHPAYDLFFPEKAADFAQSLVWMAESGGAFPRWPVAGGEGGSMIGQPHAIALADAWVKGVTDWDLPGAWPTLVAQARGELAATYNAMPGVADLDTLRYLPSDRYGGSVAWTQELAWADWSLAQIASSVGDAENAAYLAWRSRGYRELYDPAMGFFHARASDGTFATELDPFAWADEYVEGNAWQYLWLAPHDAEGLAALLGGEDAARARLDEFFDGAVAEGLTDWPGTYYWHGNEPDLHAAWLYALWGDPASTVERVDWILDTLYDDQPAGLAGNDDGGTLSAWYLFATIGFYPIAGSTSYVLGVPRFPLVEIDRPDGVLVVRRDGTGVPERVEVDGEVLDGPVIRHPALAGGSVVRFVGRGD